MHLQQNSLKQTTKKSLQYEVTSEIREIFNAPTLENAQILIAELIKKYEKTQSKLADWLEENLHEVFTVFAFPK